MNRSATRPIVLVAVLTVTAARDAQTAELGRGALAAET